MNCPYCGYPESKVIDSRPTETQIRRRRECMRCGRRFTTYERVETIPVMVIKKDKSREPFDRRKIENGVLSACHKRPVSAEKIHKMIDDIENEILSGEQREVDSSVIGELVMKKLHGLDEVAYVRFASVYREFKDVRSFLTEIESFVKERKGPADAADPAENKKGREKTGN